MSAPKSRDERGWNEDWQVGDIAECVADDWVRWQEFNPKKGDILTVSRLYEGPSINGNVICSYLLFEGKPNDAGWHCIYFRKHRGVAEAIKQAASRGARVRMPEREGVEA